MQKIKSITVIGRVFYDELAHKSFHSIHVLVDGISVGQTCAVEGGPTEVESTAKKFLMKHGLLDRITKNQSLFDYCRSHKIYLITDQSLVVRKTSLHQGEALD